MTAVTEALVGLFTYITFMYTCVRKFLIAFPDGHRKNRLSEREMRQPMQQSKLKMPKLQLRAQRMLRKQPGHPKKHRWPRQLIHQRRHQVKQRHPVVKLPHQFNSFKLTILFHLKMTTSNRIHLAIS